MNEFLNFDFCSVHVSMRCIRRQREKRAQKEELAVAGVAGWVCVSCHCFPYRRKYCYGFLTHSGDGGRAAAFLFSSGSRRRKRTDAHFSCVLLTGNKPRKSEVGILQVKRSKIIKIKCEMEIKDLVCKRKMRKNVIT